MTKSNDILAVERLNKSYPAARKGGHPLLILEDVDLHMQAASSIAITGNSGSGKSTLLQVSAGLLSFDSGRIVFNGNDLERCSDAKRSALRNTSMGFIFQSSLLLNDFSARENVMIPAMMAGKSEREAKEKAIGLLETVGLGDRLDHGTDQLSGGERQRVAIARALVNDPLLIYADEPTGSLDERNANLIEDLLFSLVEHRDVSLMLVTHNTHFASRCAKVYRLHDRHLKEES